MDETLEAAIGRFVVPSSPIVDITSKAHLQRMHSPFAMNSASKVTGFIGNLHEEAWFLRAPALYISTWGYLRAP